VPALPSDTALGLVIGITRLRGRCPVRVSDNSPAKLSRADGRRFAGRNTSSVRKLGWMRGLLWR